jgi:HTH-type transcriptional regulator / antitoxin HigA
MDIAPIKSNRDYRRVLKEIDGVVSARRNSPEGDRLDVPPERKSRRCR